MANQPPVPMEFCPTCGNLLTHKEINKNLYKVCRTCDYKTEATDISLVQRVVYNRDTTRRTHPRPTKCPYCKSIMSHKVNKIRNVIVYSCEGCVIQEEFFLGVEAGGASSSSSNNHK